jgi:septum formation protein
MVVVSHRLVLASASPARRRLLAQAGLVADVVVSGVDEASVIAGLGPVPPAEVVEALAVRKARAVAALVEADAAGEGVAVDTVLVVGCDSMLEVDGVVFGRPVDAADAAARWRCLRGGAATLLTGHAVVEVPSGRLVSAVAATVVRFGSPTDDEIAAYVATGEPLAVAGAFTLDGRSAPFVEGVDGDPGNVIGLSLPLLRRLLAELDVPITSLWR